ncbi:MAG: substrate-binding domain-containing protein [Clostridiales bacterium]|nr:substrate-binding domain-containing protein [Clostridiales bacterium]
MFNKRILSMLMVVLLALGAFAGFAVAEDKEIVIGIAPKMVGAPYWDYANQGCMKAGEALGITVNLQASTTASAQEQAAIIDNFITLGVDAIVVAANDESTLLPVLNRASEAGIPIVTYDSDVPASQRLYCVASCGQIELGEMMAKELVNVMGEEGEVAFMTGSLSAFNHNQILQGYHNVLDHYAGISVVTTVESGDDQQQAFINAENLVASYPNLKGILGVAAGETPSAAEAVMQAGLSGQIKIVGVATPNSVKEYYEEGVLESTLLWDPAAMGFIAVKIAYDYLNGVLPENGQVLFEGGNPVTIDEAGNIFIGTTVFTNDNIWDFDF